MKEMWQDLIDVNAGPVATGEAEISEIGTEIFNKILAVASGEDQSFAEKYKLHNDLCILILHRSPKKKKSGRYRTSGLFRCLGYYFALIIVERVRLRKDMSET